MWEVGQREGECVYVRERERERGGLCRACELSSGRRRHWKNRTEINRSVFFAELEHGAFPLACSSTIFSAPSLAPRPPLVPPTGSPRLLPPHIHPVDPSLFLFPSRVLVSLPPSPPSPPPRRSAVSFLPSLVLLRNARSVPRPEALLLEEFTLLLPDRPGRLRWTFDVDR